MYANASLLWLEPAAKDSSSVSEEQLIAKLFATSCTAMGVASTQINELQDFQPPPRDAKADSIVLIAGNARDKSRLFFIDLGQKLRRAGANPIFVIDALTDIDNAQKKVLVNHLDRECFHITNQETAIKLLRSPAQFYTSQKPEIMASILVYLPISNSIVMLGHSSERIAQSLSLPAGHLQMLGEDLQECAARIFREYTDISVFHEELKLIHVRSKPEHGSKNHIIDHTYLCLIPPNEEEGIVKALKENCQESRIQIISLEQVLKQELDTKLKAVLNDAMIHIKEHLGKSVNTVMLKRMSILLGL